MQFARDLQMRFERAVTLKAHPWVSALAIVAGGIVARIIVFLTPATGGDVAKARELGIVSATVLAGYSKSADSLAYVLALAGAIITSVGIWMVWAIRAKPEPLAEPPVPWKMPRVSLIEFGIVAVIAFALFGRFWNGRGATISGWSVLVEEGEMLAWVDTVFRGGALFRDSFCLYGPLSIWPVAALFHIFNPSIGLWRTWIFSLNPPAVIATYFVLRGITRTRLAAVVGALFFGVLCPAPAPAMSWSLARVGLGFATIAVLTRGLDRGATKWFVFSGALIGVTILYSQEVGIAVAVAVAAVLVFRSDRRTSGILWTMLGCSLALAPAVIYLIATQSLGATFENLFLFPRVRMLGFAAQPFPALSLNSSSLRAYFIPAVLVVASFWTTTKLLRGYRDARSLTELALIIFGALLFTAALSRPDDAHFPFVFPPALVLLCVLSEDLWLAIRTTDYRIATTSVALLGVVLLAPWSSMLERNLRSLVEPPSGRALLTSRGGSALLPEDFARDLDELIQAIQSRTAPDEPIWVFPNEAMLYFLADRPQPTHFPDALFAVTRAQREQLVADLERARPRWAIVYRDAPEVDNIPYAVALPEVVAYLNANYEAESEIGYFILMRRTN